MEKRIFFVKAYIFFLFIFLGIGNSIFPFVFASILLLVFKDVRSDLKDFFKSNFGSLKIDYQKNKSIYKAIPIMVGISISISIIDLATMLFVFEKFQLNIHEKFSKHFSDYGPVWLFFMVVIYAPIVEEILFRHFTLKPMTRIFSVFSSIVFTSLIFALLHPQNIIGSLIFSVFCCFLVLKTNSLWLAYFFHFLNNFILTLVGLFFEQEQQFVKPTQLEVLQLFLFGLIAFGALMLISHYIYNLKNVFQDLKHLLRKNFKNIEIFNLKRLIEGLIVVSIVAIGFTINFSSFITKVDHTLGSKFSKSTFGFSKKYLKDDYVSIKFTILDKSNDYWKDKILTFDCSGSYNNLRCKYTDLSLRTSQLSEIKSISELYTQLKQENTNKTNKLTEQEIKNKFHDKLNEDYFKNKLKTSCLIKPYEGNLIWNHTTDKKILNFEKEKFNEIKIVGTGRAKREDDILINIKDKTISGPNISKQSKLIGLSVYLSKEHSKYFSTNFEDQGYLGLLENIKLDYKCDEIEIVH